MNPIKQIGILFLFLILATGTLISFMDFATSDFKITIVNSSFFCFSFVSLILLVMYIIKDEVGYRDDELWICKRGKIIFEFHYKKANWVDFAKQLHRNETYEYFKIFMIVTFCFLIFLILLFKYDDLSVFAALSFVIGIIWLPILIGKILIFRNRKKIYLEETKPSILVTEKGIIINSKIVHSFTRLRASLYKVKIENYASLRCISITTYHPSPSKGGHFKTSYIPIPTHVHIKEKKIERYIEALEKIIQKR